MNKNFKISTFLKMARHRSDMSQDDVKDFLKTKNKHLTKSAISSWESGKVIPPSDTFLILLEKFKAHDLFLFEWSGYNLKNYKPDEKTINRIYNLEERIVNLEERITDLEEDRQKLIKKFGPIANDFLKILGK